MSDMTDSIANISADTHTLDISSVSPNLNARVGLMGRRL